MADKTLHTRRWTDLPERGTPTMLRLIHWTATAVGRWAARLLLYPTTLYFVLSAHTARRMSYQYLKRVRGRPAHWWHVFRHFHCFAATILDRVYLLTGAFQHFEIKFHDREILHQQVESGQGCILLGSHLGSFEVLRALGVTRAEFPLKVLMDVVHNENITRYLDALNPEIASTVIVPDRPDTLLKVKESLDGGFLVGTLGDRNLSNRRDPYRRHDALSRHPLLWSFSWRQPLRNFFRAIRRGNSPEPRPPRRRHPVLDAALCRSSRALRATCTLQLVQLLSVLGLSRHL